jgi:hypothetical protein
MCSLPEEILKKGTAARERELSSYEAREMVWYTR